MVAMVAFVLVDASAVKDDRTRADKRVTLYFKQRDHRDTDRPISVDNQEHIPGVLGYQQYIYRRTESLTRTEEQY